MGGLIPGTEPWDAEHPWYAQVVVKEDGEDFAAAFSRMESMMDFGGAIAGVKAGHKVYREQWGMEAPGRHIRLDGIDRVVSVIEGSVLPFLPSSEELLAEDWRFFNEHLGGDVVAGDPVARETYDGRDGPTVPKETIDNGNATFVDTASAGAVPVAPREDAPHEVAGIPMPDASGPRPSHHNGQRGGERVDGDGPA